MKRLADFIKLMPTKHLSTLSAKQSDSFRAIRHLETELKANAGNSAIISEIQKFFFAEGQVDNGNGLADFFDPRDNRQLAYIMEAGKHFDCVTELRLDVIDHNTFTAFDIKQLLSSMKSNSHGTRCGRIFYLMFLEYLLELIYSRLPRDASFLDTINGFERDACLALGKWNILEEEYAQFEPHGIGSATDKVALLRWSLGKAPSLDMALVQDSIVPPILYLKAASTCKLGTDKLDIAGQFNTRQGLDLAIGLKLFDLFPSANHLSDIMSKLKIELIQNLRTEGNFKKAFVEFLRLDDEQRKANLILQADLLDDMGFKMKAIEFLEFSIQENIIYEPYKGHLRLASLKNESCHFTDKNILKHYEMASKLSNDAQVYFQFAKYLDNDFGLLSMQEYEQSISIYVNGLGTIL